MFMFINFLYVIHQPPGSTGSRDTLCSHPFGFSSKYCPVSCLLTGTTKPYPGLTPDLYLALPRGISLVDTDSTLRYSTSPPFLLFTRLCQLLPELTQQGLHSRPHYLGHSSGLTIQACRATKSLCSNLPAHQD